MNENEIIDIEAADRLQDTFADQAGWEMPKTYNEEPGLAVRALRFLERLELQMDYGKWRKNFPEDLWWVAKGEEVTGPVNLRTILERLLQGDGPLQFAPVVENEEATRWRTLHYRPLWRNRKAALTWKLGLYITCAALVYVIVWGLTPYAFRGIVNAGFALSLLGLGLKSILRPVWRTVTSFCKSTYWALEESTAGLIFLRAVKHASLLAIISLGCVLSVVVAHSNWQHLVEGSKAVAVWYHSLSDGSRRVEQADVPAPPESKVVRAAEQNSASPELAKESGLEADYKPVAAEQHPPKPQPTAPDLTALANSPAQWPKTVALKESTNFPAVLRGKVIGTVRVPAGTLVRLAGIEGDQLKVEYQRGVTTVPAGITDVAARVSIVPASDVVSEPAAEKIAVAPAIANTQQERGKSHANAESLAAAPGIARAPAEVPDAGVPGLDVQENYFGRLSPYVD
jgi:hypothetical protein